MAPLTKDLIRNHNVHTPQLVPLPAKAAAVFHHNAIVAVDAAGLAVPGANTAGLVIMGIAYKRFDNSAGANGVVSGATGSARVVEVDQAGEWEFAVQGAAPKPGQPALVVDDNTVSADATTQNLKLGRFTRPGHDGGWFVDVERR